MIHAYLFKGIKSVFASRSCDGRDRGRNEDAVTSMVFSPLTLMRPDDVLDCLLLLLGSDLARLTNGRAVAACSVDLWPSGLAARNANGEQTRCEPDVTVRFEFGDNRALLVVLEVKWAWYPTAQTLDLQLGRQRDAVLASSDHGADDILSAAITQHRIDAKLRNGLHLTWTDVHERLHRRAAASPAEKWGKLTAAFLAKARQVSFQGMDRWEHIDAPRHEGSVFFRETFEWPAMPLIVRPESIFYEG